jgi:hypothetical protein
MSRIALFGLLLAFAIGCGGAEKGKNHDYDRPKTPDTKKG